MPELTPVRVDSAPPAPAGAAALVTIKRLNPSAAAAWDDYVVRSPAATFCHLSGWARVVERTWGHASHCLYAEQGGAVVGVLPLFYVRSRLFGSVLVSSPNAVYGGIVADDPDASAALFDEAQRLARRLAVDHLELRQATDDQALSSRTDLVANDLYAAFEHDICADEEKLMASFPRDVRRMIRNGVKSGLTSERGGLELLNEFYDVYATSVRDLGTPVFPKRLFAEFLREFPDACDILIVRQGVRVAGGVLSFYSRDTVLPYYGGAYQEFYRAGVNNVMYWELMRLSATRGFTRFDFGRSKRGSGAYLFKRGWSMRERTLPYKYLLVRATKPPNLNPLNPKFALPIRMWKRLPLFVTKAIGPSIVSHLP